VNTLLENTLIFIEINFLINLFKTVYFSRKKSELLK
jgi:hypothetical protein